MRYRLMVICLIAWIMLAIPGTVLAQSFDANKEGSISVILKEQDGRTAIAGAELSLYYVASASLNSKNNLSYTFVDAFKDCDIALDDAALSGKLDVYVTDHAVPISKCVTDSKGKVKFEKLPLGLYFVKQTNTVTGYAKCSSFLVTIPGKSNGGYVYEVDASPKTEIEKLTSITIKKVWNTDKATEIADTVTVQLLRDGVVVQTATLNAENNWQITYNDMPKSDAYSILEINVPKGFTATYSRNGDIFTVTNSATLIQTGQLMWPIPVLAMAGMILIVMGVIILRRTRENNA